MYYSFLQMFYSSSGEAFALHGKYFKEMFEMAQKWREAALTEASKSNGIPRKLGNSYPFTNGKFIYISGY